jgi:hypothetical protein
MPNRFPSFSRTAATLAVAAAAMLGAPAAGAETLRLFTIGTASLAGNYYAAGRAICALINREGPPDLRCSPEPTPGSQYNLLGLQKGELDFAFVQSDWQHRAHAGTGPFAGAAMGNLRSVMSLYAEAVTLVVRADGGIDGLDDLPGRIVDLGNPSTARRGTVDRVLRGIGVEPASFGRIAELSTAAVGPELCAGRVDAAFLVIGHPNALLGETLRRCELRLVALGGPEMRRFVEESDDFEVYAIPAGTYPSEPDAVRTVSTLATLVTRSEIDDALVGYVARTIIARYDMLAEQVPALGRRDMDAMRVAGLTAPLHPAAAAAFDAAQVADGIR